MFYYLLFPFREEFIGFNVVPDDQVKSIAEASGVAIRLYSIIYRITEDVRDAMLGMLDAKFDCSLDRSPHGLIRVSSARLFEVCDIFSHVNASGVDPAV